LGRFCLVSLPTLKPDHVFSPSVSSFCLHFRQVSGPLDECVHRPSAAAGTGTAAGTGATGAGAASDAPRGRHRTCANSFVAFARFFLYFLPSKMGLLLFSYLAALQPEERLGTTQKICVTPHTIFCQRTEMGLGKTLPCISIQVLGVCGCLWGNGPERGILLSGDRRPPRAVAAGAGTAATGG